MSFTDEELGFIYFILDLAYDHGFLEDPDEHAKLGKLTDRLQGYLFKKGSNKEVQ